MDNKMRPTNSVFTTSAGPNLIRENFLDVEWLKSMQANNRLSLKSAKKPERQRYRDDNVTYQNG